MRDAAEAKRHQLRRYNEAMSLCHTRYTGTGQCSRYIDRTIAFAKADLSNPNFSLEEEREHPTSPGSALSKVQGKNKIDDWLETFVSKPKQYLRIALTVDVWMSIGRMAGDNNLSCVLMLEDGDGGMGVTECGGV
jgi:hypothetical protein